MSALRTAAVIAALFLCAGSAGVTPALAGDAIINNGPGLLLVVEKVPWGNTLDITRNVEKAIKDMQPGLPDVKIDTTIFRPATFIEMSR